jgi:hypothetical protein
MPVRPKPSGPSTLKQRHPFSARHPAATAYSGSTMVNSSSVRVADQKSVEEGRAGSGASGGKRQIANRPGKTQRGRLFTIRSFAGSLIRSDYNATAVLLQTRFCVAALNSGCNQPVTQACVEVW